MFTDLKNSTESNFKNESQPTLYSCVYCGHSFSAEKLLLKHTRIVKGVQQCGVKYFCKCDRSFSVERKLLWHQKNECGRSFMCTHCHRLFGQKSNLNKHQQICAFKCRL